MLKPIILGLIGVGVGFFVNYVYTTSAENDIFIKLAVTVLAGLYAGLLFLAYILPAISDGISRMLFSDTGGEPVDDDPMRDARALQAQGDSLGAIESLRHVVADEPHNRLAWLEVAKIQINQLDDAAAGLTTLVSALEGQEWMMDDAAFFMFRIAEVQLENLGDKEAAVEVLRRVCTLFPETRYSANATHQLHELGGV